MSENPIGIFDSGLGGLTVAAAIARLLPHENLVYLGDTARVPFADKIGATVVKYAQSNLKFLANHRVKQPLLPAIQYPHKASKVLVAIVNRSSSASFIQGQSEHSRSAKPNELQYWQLRQPSHPTPIPTRSRNETRTPTSFLSPVHCSCHLPRRAGLTP